MRRAGRDPDCPLCAQPELEVSSVIGRHHDFRCPNCRLIRMNPLPRVGVADDSTGFDPDRFQTFALRTDGVGRTSG
jgi:hypothetical protein